MGDKGIFIVLSAEDFQCFVIVSTELFDKHGDVIGAAERMSLHIEQIRRLLKYGAKFAILVHCSG
eukprot:scaffold1404_cov37-Cyclotella_meneghiniana.AAC.3